MISPDGVQPAHAQPVAEDIDAEACHYQNRAPKLKRVQRLAEDGPPAAMPTIGAGSAKGAIDAAGCAAASRRRRS
jgi:hypothetical protein